MHWTYAFKFQTLSKIEKFDEQIEAIKDYELCQNLEKSNEESKSRKMKKPLSPEFDETDSQMSNCSQQSFCSQQSNCSQQSDDLPLSQGSLPSSQEEKSNDLEKYIRGNFITKFHSLYSRTIYHFKHVYIHSCFPVSVRPPSLFLSSPSYTYI